MLFKHPESGLVATQPQVANGIRAARDDPNTDVPACKLLDGKYTSIVVNVAPPAATPAAFGMSSGVPYSANAASRGKSATSTEPLPLSRLQQDFINGKVENGMFQLWPRELVLEGGRTCAC
jgi:hypothetical protein